MKAAICKTRDNSTGAIPNKAKKIMQPNRYGPGTE